MVANNDPAFSSVHDVTCDDYSALFGSPGAFSKPYGNCAKELARFMNTIDQKPSVPGSTVDTYAIGFGLTGPGAAQTWQYLQDVTQAGGGGSLEATDLSTLVGRLQVDHRRGREREQHVLGICDDAQHDDADDKQ